MTRTKKWIFIVLAVLIAAGAGAALLLGRSAKQTQQAQAQHQSVFDLYRHMMNAAAQAELEITETDRDPVSLSLDALGLLAGTQAQIAAQFTPDDLLDPDAFAALPAERQLAWAAQPQPAQRSAALDLSAPDMDAVCRALDTDGRTAPQDAQLFYQDGRFVLEPEQSGDALDVDAVRARVADALSSAVITESGLSLPTVMLDADCYLRPSVTLDTLNVSFPDELTARAENLSLRVALRDSTTELSQSSILSLLSVDDEGVVSVDRAKLEALAAAWGEQYNTYNTDFILDSYVDGPIPISLLQCDYILDEAALCDRMEALLLSLESGEAAAEFRCMDPNGGPFVIQDTYIEVDLTNQVMTFIKDGELIVSTDIVSGCNAVSATPRGLYFTSQKLRNTTLIGPTWADFVEYWISITPSNTLGLHDASWRDEFGGDIYLENGSHGCINTPLDAIRTIYETVEDDTPVLVYHHARPGSNEPSL